MISSPAPVPGDDVLSLIHHSSGVTVARIRRLDGWWAKGIGVIGMRSLPPAEGVWLPGVSAVHTLFVRFPLDLLFLDDQFRTVRMVPDFPIWRPLARASPARHTLELGAGTFIKSGVLVREGDRWTLCPDSG